MLKPHTKESLAEQEIKHRIAIEKLKGSKNRFVTISIFLVSAATSALFCYWVF